MGFAFSKKMIFLFIALLFSASSIMAVAPARAPASISTSAGGTVYLVGEPWGWFGFRHYGYNEKGWTINYQRWANSKTFYPGDTLRFYYANADEPDYVVQVTQSDYETCDMTSPVATYTSGDDYITLETEGDYYFVSGGLGHCTSAGQKVHIKVVPPSLSSSQSPVAAAARTSRSRVIAPSPDDQTSNAASLVPSTSSLSSWIIMFLAVVISAFFRFC